MATVISNDNLVAHNVNKYNFKVIAIGGEDSDTHAESNSVIVPSSENTSQQGEEIDSNSLNKSSKESLIESLMQKTDEMSTNFIKLQMKLESKEEEFELTLQKAKEDAYTEGIEAGVAKALNDLDHNLQSSTDLFSDSILKLENSATEFETALEGIKKELIHAALDISQEVVKVELSTNSDEVAKVLSEELLKDLQTASKITLKVNPKNHAYISEKLGTLEHVDISSDSAVSEGGVIVLSDAGNIDSQISKRFQRVKRAALSE